MQGWTIDSRGLNSSHEICCQAPLPSELSCYPYSCFWQVFFFFLILIHTSVLKCYRIINVLSPKKHTMIKKESSLVPTSRNILLYFPTVVCMCVHVCTHVCVHENSVRHNYKKAIQFQNAFPQAYTDGWESDSPWHTSMAYVTPLQSSSRINTIFNILRDFFAGL